MLCCVRRWRQVLCDIKEISTGHIEPIELVPLVNHISPISHVSPSKSHSWSAEVVGHAVADQNRIVDDHSPFAGQKLSVARPCEAEDSIGGEAGQLACR